MEDRENAQDMGLKAMEKLAETKRRKEKKMKISNQRKEKDPMVMKLCNIYMRKMNFQQSLEMKTGNSRSKSRGRKTKGNRSL